MAVESVNHIGDLDPTSPSGAAPKSEGDDQIRTVKKAIKITFLGIKGPVTATHAEINLLSGKTSVVTKEELAAAQLSTSIPGIDDPVNADKFLRGDGAWATVDLRGAPISDKGSTGTTPQVVDYADGEGQTITATGAHTLSVTGFPGGRLAGVLLRMIGYGSFSLTTTGITWVKADGSLTTSFETAGITLSASLSLVSLFSFGDGVVYAKVAR